MRTGQTIAFFDRGDVGENGTDNCWPQIYRLDGANEPSLLGW